MKRIGVALRFARRIAAANASDLFRDGAGLSGAVLIAYGVRLIYEPAGFIIAGMMLVFIAWRLGRLAE